MIRKLCVLVCVLACASASHAGDPSPTWTGKWHNALCSELEIKSVDQKTGLMAGTYRTGVGNPAKTQVFQMTGFANGDLVAFSVNWGVPDTGVGSDSLTSWAGQHTVAGGSDLIRTMWNLARNVDDANEGTNLWSGILAGSDGFHRGAVPANCVPQP